ncbi:MAG: hypothetical protein EKK46_09710 [Rhodocyclaceae bacterium]|nr:MAG: hypothetical protein EKK46_09710 [Rhodocyclaceae bacterium]
MKKPLFFALLPAALLAASSTVQAEGFADLLRGVTNAIGGAAAPAQPASGVTPVIGVRGIDDDNVPTPTSGGGGNAGLSRLEHWAETTPWAEAAAGKRGLVARNVTLAEEGKP